MTGERNGFLCRKRSEQEVLRREWVIDFLFDPFGDMLRDIHAGNFFGGGKEGVGIYFADIRLSVVGEKKIHAAEIEV